MKYRFMKEHQESHNVELMARAVHSSRSGYYRWLKKPRSEQKQEDDRLVDLISEIQRRSRYRYGSPRVTEALHRQGYRVGHNRIARLMRENDLGRRVRKRFRSTTDSKHTHPVAENVVNRQFEVPRVNHTWVSDISFIATAEGWLYLCVIIDLYSRKVVGWAMSSRMKTKLVMNALLMAYIRRKPPEGLIFHSDRGSQYCSHAFRARLKNYRMIQSMSRKGDCWDNAPAESFFKTLKFELNGHRAYRSRQEARRAIFEYIEVFYNRQRLHSALGYVTPVEFEELSGRVAA